tara:strand:- start:5038 stop:8832 length:3795 start_codon:yes stop_codon:yes gene_type:complete
MKKIVFTFGRFNPPTTGHLLLATKVKEEARRRGAEHAIFGSSSTDKKKNPLSPRDKQKYMKKVLKGFNVSVDAKANTPFVLLKKLSDAGYTDVTMVVGGDRVAEFQKQIPKYIGKEYMFTNFEVVSAGDRDPDAEGVEGMSASKMRGAAAEGNYQAFLLGLPTHMSERDTKGLFAAVQKGMGIKPFIAESWFNHEEFVEFREETINELSTQGRRKLQRAAKKTAKRRMRARKMKEKRRKGTDQIKAKAGKEAVKRIRKKILGDRKWSEVSFQEREKIGKKVQKKKAAIARISKRLVPQMKKAETERLQQVRQRMTTNDPAKAVESMDVDFLSMINEASSVDSEARRRKVEREQNRGTGASNPKERDAARKRGERDSGNPWDSVIAIRDSQDKIKLILAQDYNPEQHDEVIAGSAPGEKPKGKLNAGKAGRLAVDPDFKWTTTAKKLLGWEQQKKSMKQQAQQQAATAKQGANQQAQQQQQQPDDIPAPELTPAKRVPKNGKKIQGKGSLFPDWDHKAVDMEAGFVDVWNDDHKVDAKVGLLSTKDQQKIKQSETLKDSSRRLVDTIKEQLGGDAEDYEAIHFGRSSEPLTSAWSDEGGTDSTPKTDLMLKNKKTGENIRVSVKCGDAQLMSAKLGEARATLKNIMDKHGDDLKKEPKTRKAVQSLLKEMEESWVTTAQTPTGSAGENKISKFLAGGEKEGEIAGLKEIDELHKQHTQKFSELMENSTVFKRAIIHESMTGEMKFGKDSDACATHVLSMNRDGTKAKLIKIDPDYIDKVALPANLNILTRFKSSQRQKTGSYSYWSALGMIVKAKGFTDTKEAFAWVANRMMNEDNENFKEYMNKATKYIGSDPGRLQEFLGIEVDSIDTSSINLADLNVEESGEYTDIVIDGMTKRIPIEKDVDYHEGEDDTETVEESVQLLREPEILDRLVQQLMAKGKSKDAAYAIANASLQKNGVLKKGSQELTDKGKKRNSMSAGERAKDRAAKKDGKSPNQYNYNKKTNIATLKNSYEFKESDRHGLGSFATENVGEGEMVGMYYLNITEDTPEYQRTDFCRLTNHSRHPNLRLEEVDGNFYTVATEDIEEGEELFIDYNHVLETIVPRLSDNGRVIQEVLRWTNGYENLEIGEDNFADLRDELEFLNSLSEEEDPVRRAKRQKEYNSTPEQRARRSSRTSLRNKKIRKGQLKVGDGKDVHHKDGNPLNNSAGNIQITSASKNRGIGNNKTNEEGGAGEYGTDALRKKLTKHTPFMSINSLDEKFNRIK